MSPQLKQEGLRERKKREKLERIERAARVLFSENGYDKTTTRKIAQEAGIGIGTLFVYFPEKRDLLFHLFSSDVRVVKERAMSALPEGTLLERLRFVFTRYFDYYAQDKSLSRVFIKELGFIADRDRLAMNSLTMELMTSFVDMIKDAQEAGEIDPTMFPPAIAYHVFCLYHAALVGWLGGTAPVRETTFSMLMLNLEMLHRGLAPRS
jgi:AcrR family transcriptional regulator